MSTVEDELARVGALRAHLMQMHAVDPGVAQLLDDGGLLKLHGEQDHTSGHPLAQAPMAEEPGLAARRAQIAATSEKAYNLACSRFNAIATTYDARLQALREQMAALDQEWEDASAELHRHEDRGGIPLYNRCPTCRPGDALPAGHERKCRP